MFKITNKRKGRNKLEQHLIETLNQWQKENAYERANITDLQSFRTALVLEKEKFCTYNERIKPTSVSVNHHHLGDYESVSISTVNSENASVLIMRDYHDVPFCDECGDEISRNDQINQDGKCLICFDYPFITKL